MQDGEPAVLCSRGGNQRVGQRNAVIAVAVLSELDKARIAASATARSLRTMRNASSSASSATYPPLVRDEYRTSIRTIGVIHKRSSRTASCTSAASSSDKEVTRHHAEAAVAPCLELDALAEFSRMRLRGASRATASDGLPDRPLLKHEVGSGREANVVRPPAVLARSQYATRSTHGARGSAETRTPAPGGP